MSKEFETVLRVTGMTCRSCAGRVDGALRTLNGVSEVEVSLREGLVRIEHDPQRAPVDGLIAALRNAGYAGSVTT